MKITQKTQNFPILWASNPDYGTLSPIPKDDPADGSASLAKGFPKATMTPLAAGGKPPRGDQFNGILNALSASAQTAETGLIPQWNKEFAQSIGGYPATAIVISNALSPDILVSAKDDNLDNPFDSNQTSWISIKKGLQPAGNYAYTNAMDAPPDDNGNVGLAWIGLSKNAATARILATDKAGDIVTAANVSDLEAYQPKGAYPFTNADIKKPDANNNIGIAWIGGWIDDKNVTRVRATDGIEGVVATCANLEDLDNYQPKGAYPFTNADIKKPDANNNIGIAWIGGWIDDKNVTRVRATDGIEGVVATCANLEDLDNYQIKGNYVPTNAPDLPVDANGNSGLGWFGFHTANGKTNLLAAGGAGSGNLVEIVPSYEDLSAYAKLADGLTNQRVEFGNGTKNANGTNGYTWISFAQPFGSAPTVVATQLNNTTDKQGSVNLWGITTTGFNIDAADTSTSFNWIAIGEI